MSARIAPEPANTVMSAVAEFRSRSSSAAQVVADSGSSPPASPEPTAAASPRSSDALPPVPAPPDPPGTMFAAAVMAGALSPKPETPQEIFLRIGRDWSPPDSELHLADRVI
jgi:hypothetical protein